MANRKTAIDNLTVGDIFHAESPNGASLVCLVASVTRSGIQARTITTQICLEFDRRAGIATWGSEATVCIIDSTAPLPFEIREIMLGIDRKFKPGEDPKSLKLTDAEKRALLYIHSYYSSNRL